MSPHDEELFSAYLESETPAELPTADDVAWLLEHLKQVDVRYAICWAGSLTLADDRTQQVTEVTLTGSANEGRDVRLATNRQFLQRAAKLGLEKLRVFGPSQPVPGRGGDCSYVWMPLAADRATQPESTMIRISSHVGKRQLAQQQARQRSAHASPSPDMAAAG